MKAVNQGQHHIPNINATMSDDSLNWSVLDDDEASSFIKNEYKIMCYS